MGEGLGRSKPWPRRSNGPISELSSTESVSGVGLVAALVVVVVAGLVEFLVAALVDESAGEVNALLQPSSERIEIIARRMKLRHPAKVVARAGKPMLRIVQPGLP